MDLTGRKRKFSRKILAIAGIVTVLFFYAVFLDAQNNSVEGTSSYQKGMFVIETVKPGEDFYSLATKYYGNRDFWVYIYLANKADIPHPEDLKPGMSVTIPQAQALGIDANNSASVAKAKELGYQIGDGSYSNHNYVGEKTGSQNGMYVAETVKPGEDFCSLATKYYGNRDFWVYIYLANKADIPHPGDLKPGMSVTIPQAAALGIDANNPESVAKARELGNNIRGGSYSNQNSYVSEKKGTQNGMYVVETVKPGFTFRELALKYYGNKEFWVYIYLANKADIPYPNDLKTGMSVTIPQASALGIDANNPASVEKAKELGDKTMAEFK